MRGKRLRFDPCVGKIPWSRKWQPLQYSCLENSMDRGVAGYSPWDCKESDATERLSTHMVIKNLPVSVWEARDLGLISWTGRSPGEGNGNPLWYSYLENSMDREAWQAVVYGVTKSRTQLSMCAPLATTSLFSVIYEVGFCFFFSLCLLHSTHRWGHVALSFSVWFVSLSIMFSRSIHVSDGKISLFMTK